MFCLLQQVDVCLVSFFRFVLFCLYDMSTIYTLNHFFQNLFFSILYSPRAFIIRLLHINSFLSLLFDVYEYENVQTKLLPSNRFNSFFSLLSESDVCTKCFFNSSCIDGLLCTMANDLVGWLSWKICELANTAKISGAKNGTFVWIWR